jgi:hypothetical protein
MAYYTFLKSLRSLEEFRKNPHTKIPPKSPPTNFQSLFIFKNPIFIQKRIFPSLSAQSNQRPTGPSGLSAHAAHPTFLPPPALKQGAATITGRAPPSNATPASPRHGCAAPTSTPHPAPITPPPLFIPPSKTPVKERAISSH